MRPDSCQVSTEATVMIDPRGKAGWGGVAKEVAGYFPTDRLQGGSGG